MARYSELAVIFPAATIVAAGFIQLIRMVTSSEADR
jgi:hypothetical protein